MKKFEDTIHCSSLTHCETCRAKTPEGEAFRKDIAKNFEVSPPNEDFKCPNRIPWNATGLTISAKKKKLAKLGMVKNFIKSAKTGLGSAIKTKIFNIDVSPDAVYKERINTCSNCPGKHAIYRNGAVYSCGPMIKSMYDAGKPTCGCMLSLKARDIKQKCPKDYWKR